MGLRDEEVYTSDGIRAARALISSRSQELKLWLKCNNTSTPNVDQLQGNCQDIMLRILPMEYRRTGPSGSVGIFLALIQLFFREHIHLRGNVASTGYLNLAGGVEPVADVLLKVRRGVTTIEWMDEWMDLPPV